MSIEVLKWKLKFKYEVRRKRDFEGGKEYTLVNKTVLRSR